MEATNETVDLTRRIERIGERLGSRHTKVCASDLAEVARATRSIMTAIDDIQSSGSVSREAVGKALVEVQTWAYEELLDHLERLRLPLALAPEGRVCPCRARNNKKSRPLSEPALAFSELARG